MPGDAAAKLIAGLISRLKSGPYQGSYPGVPSPELSAKPGRREQKQDSQNQNNGRNCPTRFEAVDGAIKQLDKADDSKQISKGTPCSC